MPNSADAGGPDLEASIDRLYQGPLERFTAERNLLAATLKKGGDKAAAERVKALAKPSATAWAVNQAWWQHPEQFQAMLDAGAAQRRAHLAWAQRRAADVRAAGEARQVAVSAVTEAALQALGGPKAVAPDAKYRIAGTVEALASSGVSEGEAPGRLTRDRQSSGLEALTAMAAAAGAVPRPTIVARGTPRAEAHAASPAALSEAAAAAPPTPTNPAGTERGESLRARKVREAEEAAARRRATELAQARMRAQALISALDAATGAAAAAAAAEAAARAALDSLTRRRTELEAALDEMRTEEAAARRALSNAAAEASRAGLDRARAARDATRAREALDRLLG